MKYILIAWVCAFLYRLTVNASALIWLNHYEKRYTQYLQDVTLGFTENTAAVTKLFKSADLTDRIIPVVQPVGFGQVLQGQTSLFNNMANRREDVVSNMIACFSTARGTFKNRITENFSPIFWINCILFLPRTVLEYLGISGESLIAKLLQLVYWVAAPLFALLRDEIHQFILTLIN